MFSAKSLALASLLSTLASGVMGQAQVSYAACMDTDPANLQQRAPSGGFETCAATCQNAGLRYAYAKIITKSPLSLDCGCSNVGPTAEQYSIASDSKMNCADTQWNALISWTTFAPPTCYTGFTSSSAAAASRSPAITVTDHIQCFNHCGPGYVGATMIPSTTGPEYSCICDQNAGDVDTALQTTCARGQLARFAERSAGSNTGYAPAGQSVWVKRQLREQLRLDSQKLQRVCPEEGRACLVAEGKESWECVDVQTELESCGGCMHGEFAALGEVSAGVDCTALPGVSMGGVTCTHGQCAIWACDPGFKLKGRECVAEK